MKPRKPIKRKKWLRSSGPLKRHTSIKSKGRPRFKAGRARRYIAWVRTNPCVLADDPRHQCEGPLECCHVKSRGAGGQDRGNCFSACHKAHRRQHEMGIKSFQSFYGIDLNATAIALDETYERTCPPRSRLEFTETELEQMECMYRDGYGTTTIAAHFGCLMGSVWSRLKKRGVIVAHRLPLPKIILHSHGYLMSRGEYVHRLVAEEMLGRALRPGECVHHRNRDRKDNRPENLEIHDSHSAHMREHRAEREVWKSVENAELKRLYLEGYSYQRIAQLLGKTLAAVGNRIRRLHRWGELPKIGKSGRKSAESREVA